MDTKKRITWGVRVGSISLAAGIVSYLGVTGDAAEKKASPQTTSGAVQGQRPEHSKHASSEQVDAAIRPDTNIPPDTGRQNPPMGQAPRHRYGTVTGGS